MPRLRLNAARSFALVAGTGAALALSFPEPGLGPLAWVAIAPLLALAAGETTGRGVLLGFVFGLGFFGALLYWISIIGVMGWIVLVVLQAAFLGVFGGLWALLSRLGTPAARIGSAAAAWVAVEFIRSLVPVGGFTWGQLAQSQTEIDWLLPLAALGGGWLVSAVVVALNAAILEVVSYAVTYKRPALVPVMTVAVLLVAPLLVPSNEATGEPIKVAIVQGNVPQDFTGPYYEKELQILGSHQHLTEELNLSEPDLVIWPESSVGMDLTTNEDAQNAVRASARAVGAPMIVGGNIDIGDDRYKVVAFHVDESGGIADVYEKTHLVPFGEYVPARSVFGWIPALEQVPRDAIAADDPVVFDIAGGKVAPVISFEGDFGSLVRKPIAKGGRLLVVATNTSTWGYSWASAQHVAFSQVRAVENGVWVAHAALSGISAFVSPNGQVIDSTSLWTAAALIDEIRFAANITLYARYGDWFPWLCVLILLVGLVLLFVTRLSANITPPGTVAPGDPETLPGRSPALPDRR
ncbi:MAG: apolipoprotein N-acyltransferase [Actinomycetota bacterium]